MKDSSNLLRRAGLALLGLGAVATALAFTFTLSNTGLPIKWPAKTVPITIMLGDTTTLTDGTNYNTSARAAANAWNAVIGSAQLQTTFGTGTPDETNNVNEMAFAAKMFGDRDFGTGVLAITTGFSSGNERTKADILFNTFYVWDSYRGPRISDKSDLQRVATHELGHLLGLDHPDEKGQAVNAIMNSRISNLDSITSDDIEGAQSLYGPPGIPANDAFANSTRISLVSTGTTAVKGFNTNATKETGDPRQGDNPGGRSVWWRWTAPAAGSVILDTRGSYYDTTLGVYTGTSLASLTKLADNDDLKLPTTADPTHVQASSVTFAVTGGTTYRFDVDGFNNSEGASPDLNGADNGGITLNLAFTAAVTGTPPTITTQPASQTVNSGSSVAFSVVATGTEPISYQWLFNSNTIAGATNSTLNLSNVISTQAGTYTVSVTNIAGSTTSNGATLTVNTPAPPPPPPPSSGGGRGGGGGSPSLWFCAVLAGLGLARWLSRRP